MSWRKFFHRSQWDAERIQEIEAHIAQEIDDNIARGFSPQEAVGQSLRNLHAADLSQAEYQKLLERVRSGSSSSSVANRRKKSGESVRVSIKTSPLLDGQGKLVGEITVARAFEPLTKATIRQILTLGVKDVQVVDTQPCQRRH